VKLSEQACPNVRCRDYGRRGGKNLYVYTRYGRKHITLIGCRTCGKTFSELTGTPFWDSRLDWNTIALIYISLIEGRGIRGTARSYSVSKNTVKRYLKIAEDDPAAIEHFLQKRGFLKEARSPGLRRLISDRRMQSKRI
jgi:hypothetical protein